MTVTAETIEISGRNVEVTDRLRRLIEDKFARIEKYFTDIIEVRCVLQQEKHRNICEIYVVGKDYDVKSIKEADTMEEAVVTTIDHLKRQARKERERITDHHRRDGSTAKKMLHSEWQVQVIPRKPVAPDSYRSRIIRTDKLPIEPMTVEEGAMKLDDSSDEFIVFRDSDTERVTVIYKRADGNFGLIAPEF